MNFSMIVAADADRGIAKDGDLPWHLPKDLTHFKQTTSQTKDADKRNALIMGRATWDTLPGNLQPLPNRLNVVLSRSMPEFDGDWLVRNTLAKGLDAVADDPSIETIFVSGGGQIYAEAIELTACTSIFYTRIYRSYGCDRFFPPFEDRFALQTVLAEHTENDTRYRIELWSRQ